MKRPLVQTAVLASCICSAARAGHVSVPVVRSEAPPILKRSVANTTLVAFPGQYHVVLRIGDPPQTVKATFDTGSDVVWVNATCEETNLGVNAHTYGARTLCSQGRYYSRYSRSASLSESHKLTPLTYGIGNATVAKVQDNVQIVGTNVNITNMPFGVGVKTYDVLLGVFGVGYGDNPQTPWEGIVSLLQRNRYTDVKAFGLALGKWHSALKEDDGTVTFGGVDTKKFAGELVGFPLQHISDGVKRYAIRLASIGLTTSQYSKQYGHSSSVVVLDSGSTLTSLPPAIVEGLAADVGAKYQESTGLYNVDCRVLSDVSTVDFTFGTASDGNLTARVPLADLIVWSGGLDTCSLGVQPATSVDLAILGQGFLRRVYSVYDQDNEQVLLAPFSNCGSNIRGIKAGQLSQKGAFVGECEQPKFGGPFTPIALQGEAVMARPHARWIAGAVAALVSAVAVL